MEYLIPALAATALLLALFAWIRSGAQSARLDELERDLIRRSHDLSAETERGLELQRRLLTTLALGGELDAEMIEEGRLWRDVSGKEALTLVNESKARILDVRTPRETVAGFARRNALLHGALDVVVAEAATIRHSSQRKQHDYSITLGNTRNDFEGL